MKAEKLKKLSKLEQEARQRILERGKIEFRLESELLASVLDLSKERKMPVGPMIRQWVKERLDQELAHTSTPTQLDVIEQKIDRLLSEKQTRS